MTRLLKAGAQLVDRLVPRADVEAACGYGYSTCRCYGGWLYQQLCWACTDGSHGCSACTSTGTYC